MPTARQSAMGSTRIASPARCRYEMHFVPYWPHSSICRHRAPDDISPTAMANSSVAFRETSLILRATWSSLSWSIGAGPESLMSTLVHVPNWSRRRDALRRGFRVGGHVVLSFAAP